MSDLERLQINRQCAFLSSPQFESQINSLTVRPHYTRALEMHIQASAILVLGLLGMTGCMPVSSGMNALSPNICWLEVTYL